MGRHALAFMEDLDSPGRDPGPEGLLQKLVGHGVVVLVDFDVVIETGPPLDPIGILVWSSGQRSEPG